MNERIPYAPPAAAVADVAGGLVTGETALFGIFFCYQCFSRVLEFEHPALERSELLAGPLATGLALTLALVGALMPVDVVGSAD